MEILENRAGWLAEYQSGWLAHYQQTGETNFKLYKRPTNSAAPSGNAVDLSRSRLLLITTSGAYLRDSQTPYDAENPLGDYSIRPIPSRTPLDRLAYAHTHYDHAAVNQDAQVLVPLRHLEALVAEGVIGALTDNALSFMGYQPDVPRVLDELIPQIVAFAKAEQAQAALLVPS